MLGNIFKNKFNIDPLEIDLIEIEKIAIKNVSFLKYAEKLVSKRGNVFKNRFYDIDRKLDRKLSSYSA
ncbi:MAG: hypothetical protein COA39_012315 [Sulfurimonas sp.]|nr:hypothetical protein [Sulfurimonas sp.]